MITTRRVLPGDNDFILLVDDDPTSLAIMERVLSRTFIIRSAKNAEQALDILQERTPALIIPDVMMPGVSGIDVCNLMNSTERLEEVPVIFVSACDKAQDYGNGYNAGGVMYIAKPIRPSQPLQMVRLYSCSIEKKETVG